MSCPPGVNCPYNNKAEDCNCVCANCIRRSEITIVLVLNVSDKIVEDLNGVVLFQQPVFFYMKIQ